MALPVAYARSRERVVRLCAAGGDSRRLRGRLLRGLRATLGFDAFAFLLTATPRPPSAARRWRTSRSYRSSPG